MAHWKLHTLSQNALHHFHLAHSRLLFGFRGYYLLFAFFPYSAGYFILGDLVGFPLFLIGFVLQCSWLPDFLSSYSHQIVIKQLLNKGILNQHCNTHVLVTWPNTQARQLAKGESLFSLVLGDTKGDVCVHSALLRAAVGAHHCGVCTSDDHSFSPSPPAENQTHDPIHIKACTLYTMITRDFTSNQSRSMEAMAGSGHRARLPVLPVHFKNMPLWAGTSVFTVLSSPWPQIWQK